ncbi:Cysteine protease family C15 [Phytophthora palmivora]|uniref:Cysteine protease family C15 n=1 Tax=Phytophthora palmivora TaxID=4796 RepID=A0A2P4Y6C7_9STRA|nr:Cysteine protease family C15 [Phytophthora palmivora]
MNVVVLNRNFGRRETHELQLVRNVWPIINLCNTLMHIIDESSPLYHLSTDELLSGDHFFVVLFTGKDNIISDTMIARKAYHACDILVDHHFVDNITLTAEGLYINLAAMNATYYDPNWHEVEQVDPESSVTSSQKRDVYVTGFGKFGDILENPTTFLAQKLVEHPKVTESHVLEERGRPCVFLHFGNEIIHEGESDEITTKLPLEEMLKTLQAVHPKIDISTDPGRYICNYVYYRSLVWTKRQADKGHPEHLALFVHVPEFRNVVFEDQMALASKIVDVIADL